MLNNEEPINLMFRTSPQLLTTSGYDWIRRQNYEEIISFGVLLIPAHLVLKHPTPKYIHRQPPSSEGEDRNERLATKSKYVGERSGVRHGLASHMYAQHEHKKRTRPLGVLLLQPSASVNKVKWCNVL